MEGKKVILALAALMSACASLGLMVDHRALASGVMLTGYGNGARTVVNYTDEPFRYGGVEVPAKDWRLLK